MQRGSRTIRLAKWAAVGIIAAWAVSMRWTFGGAASPAFIAGFENGAFAAVWSDVRAGAGGFEWFLERDRWLTNMTLLLTLTGNQRARARWTRLLLPLWLPLVLLALPTALLFWLDRRKLRPGSCVCAYDLTGNVSGVCPECGRCCEQDAANRV